MRKFLLPMATNPQNAARTRKLLLVFLFLILCVVAVFAYYQNRPWKVPEEAKRRKNPIQSSPAALAAARVIYLDKCANCHGETGKGDGSDAAMYYPSPTNLTDAKHMNSLTDGEIFYQISQGRKPMPAFKKRLTEEQRWQLVLFVRSLAATDSSNH
jgi:mono/diheme cytochrome c family protein